MPGTREALFWPSYRVIPEDGKTKVLRSADRYLTALSGILEARGR
jgi:hypothetical protein